MLQPTSEFWLKIYEAREKLAAQIFDHPEVRLIEITYARDPANPDLPGQIFLQVHLQHPEAIQRLNIPPQIDGIPVRTTVGEYGPEAAGEGT